ncbi:uncharacterized protein VP01_5302g1, partial [Puccinia sorghi]
RRLSGKPWSALIPRLANRTPLPLNKIPLGLPSPIPPLCSPNPPLMGPVALLLILFKVVFATLFKKDYAATWSQPYLTKAFNREPVVFLEFINDFKSSFFDHDHHHRTDVALRNLCQTSTVLAYTQDLNSHARTVGWADTPLMRLHWNGLKENIQLAVVMSNIKFDSLWLVQAMALKVVQTIEGIFQRPPCAPPTCLALCSTLRNDSLNPLSPTKALKILSQAGHVSCGCLNGGQRPQGHQEPSHSAWISKLQAEINRLRGNPNPSSPTPVPENTGLSKNGAVQV